MRVEAATKPPASDNVAYPGVSAGQTFGICFLYRPPTSWSGLVQQLDQIAASRDLILFCSASFPVRRSVRARDWNASTRRLQGTCRAGGSRRSSAFLPGAGAGFQDRGRSRPECRCLVARPAPRARPSGQSEWLLAPPAGFRSTRARRRQFAAQREA